MKLPYLLISLAICLAGCKAIPSIESMQQRANEHFTPSDVITPVAGKPSTDTSGAIGPISPASFAEMIASGASSLDKAIFAFDQRCIPSSAEQVRCRLERNSAQDRLIAASNAICRQYKNQLKRSHAESNQTYGILATTFGGIGAVVTSATPARLFSGAASVITGVRAENNQAMYSMLAIEVITKAIDKGRVDSLKQIDVSQRNDIGNYSLARAIADAEEYHSKCSLLAGLQEASSAVAHANDIGLKELNETLINYGKSVEVPLGAQRWESVTKTPVLLSPVCLDFTTRLASEIEAEGINIADPKYSAAWTKLESIFGKKGFCVQTAASSDKNWVEAYENFMHTTGTQEKDTYASAITAQRLRASADITYVRVGYEEGIKELRRIKALPQ